MGDIMATVIMAVIGIIILAFGALLMFLTISGKGWVKNLRPTSRVKHGILSTVVMLIGIAFLILNFME